MSENERVREIRRKYKLTMEEFGKRIGITKSSVSLLEQGRNKPSDQTRRSICREFGVREEWLRTGEEPMTVPGPSGALGDLREKYPGLTSETLALIETLVRLPAEKQAVITDFMREVVSRFGATSESVETKHGGVAKAKMTRDDLIAELDRQLGDQEEAAEKSAAFGTGNSAVAS